MRTPRLPVVDLTDAPADLNGLVRFAERRNLVSARVPSHFKRGLAMQFKRFAQSAVLAPCSTAVQPGMAVLRGRHVGEYPLTHLRYEIRAWTRNLGGIELFTLTHVTSSVQ